jgi:hypothetical protein
MDAKYDGFKMDKIIEEMKKVTIRISFVIPKLLIFFFFLLRATSNFHLFVQSKVMKIWKILFVK